ncbi:hypothetical protein F66182_2246 [Fusarium sp. NRRL 66182]|nr:hypothetical protein F66182_2246 [Fusarium sp. NRRL 66182]
MEQQPVQHQEKPETNHVLRTPLWIVIVRGFQFLVALIILGLCARIINDAFIDELGFSLAVALITWIVVIYTVVTEKVPGLHSAYHILAVLVLDALLIILWLAAWAAAAARRAKFVVPVNVSDCVDDGSLVNSKTCTIFKRDSGNVILFRTGLAMFSAIAGLGALVWLLFIATFAWTLIMFLRGRKQGRFAIDTSALNNVQMETKTSEAQPVAQTQPFQGAPQQYQQQQQQQQYPPQNAPAAYQQPQSPYQQQGAYPPPPQAAPYSPQDQQQFQGQQNYGQYPPQQQYQQPPQPYGSELSAQTQFTTPPPVATSPPPQQPYPAHPQQ